jgi:glycine cleavage system H protein
VAPAAADSSSKHEYCVPGGAFVSPGHVWARIEASGMVRAGLDDFARKALGPVDSVQVLVRKGEKVKQGDPLFEIRRGGVSARFGSPLSGRVAQVHEAAISQPALVTQSPYERGWVCTLEPSDLASELSSLRIGKPVVDWYQQEIQKLRGATTGGDGAQEIEWAAFEREFLSSMAASRA